jgi:plastocyanin
VARRLALAAGLVAVAAPALRAQSVLERPPNLDVSWVAPPGGVQFDFLHRFTVSSAPARKVSNSPTFLLGVGLPGRLMAGFNYATYSDVASAYPNEWEFLGRWQALSSDVGAPIDATIQGGYNLAARSVDGALGLGRAVGSVRLMAEGRVLGDAYGTGQTRGALAGGGTVHLGRFLALGGDAGRLLGSGEHKAVWGAGLQIAIPYTPHTLSLQTTNTNTGTLQGASRASGSRRYGFAFTIPLSLGRYFGGVAAAPAAPPAGAVVGAAVMLGDSARAESPPAGATPPPPPAVAPSGSSARAPVSAAPSSATAAAAPAGGAPARRAPTAAPASARRTAAAAAHANIRNLAFLPATIQVAAGGEVVWTNHDAVAHSLTAVDGSFDSGLIQPGATWRHTFPRAGTFAFHCTPHPFMHGTVVVR